MGVGRHGEGAAHPRGPGELAGLHVRPRFLSRSPCALTPHPGFMRGFSRPGSQE